jgi:hypothetical protein
MHVDAADEPGLHRPYQWRGAAAQLMRCYAPEVLLSGPAGTGKSRACLEKLHGCAENVPGLRGLILRQTRESLTESALVTLERHVVPEGHPCLEGAQRASRSAYLYPNGSEIAVRGLRQGGTDQAARVMSAEYDLIYVQEATEIAEEACEGLTTRLRNGALPYQQLMMDCNPDRPTHWLKRRCDAGRCLMLHSRHEDNPRLYEGAGWTAEGASYLAKLDALTGPRKLRLRHGLWVQAEGIVWDGYDPAVHLIDRRPIPGDWPRVLSVDFGYTHPFVCQWWAADGDGRAYRYREIYHTRRLVEDHARDILRLSGWAWTGEKMVQAREGADPPPLWVVCDHDAEDRATLERHLHLPTVPANKAVSPGLQAVAARLKRAGDGRPRLYLMRDSLAERDPHLDEAKLPCCTEEEIEGYVWDTGAGRRKGDQPLKANDHGCDAMRYLVYTVDGGRRTVTDDQPTRIMA